MKTFLNNFN